MSSKAEVKLLELFAPECFADLYVSILTHALPRKLKVLI